jgi:hypothetical protein|tara:strand:+ start:320 stop:526 length:207 start_codon:yes stop_codon:yes gene_type:complete
MKVSNCCGAEFYDLKNKICKCCDEQSDAIEQKEPSIQILEIPVGSEPYPKWDEKKKEYDYPLKKGSIK